MLKFIAPFTFPPAPQRRAAALVSVSLRAVMPVSHVRTTPEKRAAALTSVRGEENRCRNSGHPPVFFIFKLF